MFKKEKVGLILLVIGIVLVTALVFIQSALAQQDDLAAKIKLHIRRLSSNYLEEVQLNSRDALVKIGKPALPFLLEALNSEDAGERRLDMQRNYTSGKIAFIVVVFC